MAIDKNSISTGLVIKIIVDVLYLTIGILYRKARLYLEQLSPFCWWPSGSPEPGFWGTDYSLSGAITGMAV